MRSVQNQRTVAAFKHRVRPPGHLSAGGSDDADDVRGQQGVPRDGVPPAASLRRIPDKVARTISCRGLVAWPYRYTDVGPALSSSDILVSTFRWTVAAWFTGPGVESKVAHE